MKTYTTQRNAVFYLILCFIDVVFVVVLAAGAVVLFAHIIISFITLRQSFSLYTCVHVWMKGEKYSFYLPLFLGALTYFPVFIGHKIDREIG